MAGEDYFDFSSTVLVKHSVPSALSASCVAGNEEIARFLLQNGAGFSSYTLIDHPVFSKRLLRLKLMETSTIKVKEVSVLETKEVQEEGVSELMSVRQSEENTGRSKDSSHCFTEWINNVHILESGYTRILTKKLKFSVTSSVM